MNSSQYILLFSSIDMCYSHHGYDAFLFGATYELLYMYPPVTFDMTITCHPFSCLHIQRGNSMDSSCAEVTASIYFLYQNGRTTTICIPASYSFHEKTCCHKTTCCRSQTTTSCLLSLNDPPFLPVTMTPVANNTCSNDGEVKKKPGKAIVVEQRQMTLPLSTLLAVSVLMRVKLKSDGLSS